MRGGCGLLCYVLGWVTGLIFFFIDKRPFVRFQAAQSIVVFGGLQNNLPRGAMDILRRAGDGQFWSVFNGRLDYGGYQSRGISALDPSNGQGVPTRNV